MATSAGASEHVHLNMGLTGKGTQHFWQWHPRFLFGNFAQKVRYHTSQIGGNNTFPRLWFNERVKGGRTVLFWCKRIAQLWPVAQHSPVLSIYSTEEHQDYRKGSTGPRWDSPSLPPDSCSSQDSEHDRITTKQRCCNKKTTLQIPSQVPPAMARCWSPLACHPSVCPRHSWGSGIKIAFSMFLDLEKVL